MAATAQALGRLQQVKEKATGLEGAVTGLTTIAPDGCKVHLGEVGCFQRTGCCCALASCKRHQQQRAADSNNEACFGSGPSHPYGSCGRGCLELRDGCQQRRSPKQDLRVVKLGGLTGSVRSLWSSDIVGQPSIIRPVEKV